MKRIGVALVGASHRSTMIFNYLKRFPSQGSIVGIYQERCHYLLLDLLVDTGKGKRHAIRHFAS